MNERAKLSHTQMIEGFEASLKEARGDLNALIVADAIMVLARTVHGVMCAIDELKDTVDALVDKLPEAGE